MIAFIGGTSLIGSTVFQGWPREEAETPYGTVILKKDKGSFFLQRHGNPPLPPHMINHRANVWALKNLGVEKVIAVNSVGSLRLECKPGSFVVPDDFLTFCATSTFYDNEMRFTVPRMDARLAHHLYSRCEHLGIPVTMGGVYIQTQGPRLETKAEINMLKNFGHVVGMTMASEVTLCLEIGLPYASLCSVDNYCHGIARVPLTVDAIQENVRINRGHIEAIIASTLREGLG